MTIRKREREHILVFTGSSGFRALRDQGVVSSTGFPSKQALLRLGRAIRYADDDAQRRERIAFKRAK